MAFATDTQSRVQTTDYNPDVIVSIPSRKPAFTEVCIIDKSNSDEAKMRWIPRILTEGYQLYCFVKSLCSLEDCHKTNIHSKQHLHLVQASKMNPSIGVRCSLRVFAFSKAASLFLRASVYLFTTTVHLMTMLAAPVSCISQHLSRMFVETHGLSVMMETIATAGFWVKLCGLKEFSSFAGSSLQSVPEATKGSVDTPHTTTIYIRSNLLSTPSSKELNNESKFEKRLIQQWTFHSSNGTVSLLLRTCAYSKVKNLQTA